MRLSGVGMPFLFILRSRTPFPIELTPQINPYSLRVLQTQKCSLVFRQTFNVLRHTSRQFNMPRSRQGPDPGLPATVVFPPGSQSDDVPPAQNPVQAATQNDNLTNGSGGSPASSSGDSVTAQNGCCSNKYVFATVSGNSRPDTRIVY